MELSIYFETLKKEIVKRITKTYNPLELIIYGSYAKGTATEESDLDLVVVLNESGLSKTYQELLSNRRKVSVLLQELRKKTPIDLLVYTKDEWNQLLQTKNSFIDEINNEGIHLI